MKSKQPYNQALKVVRAFYNAVGHRDRCRAEACRGGAPFGCARHWRMLDRAMSMADKLPGLNMSRKK